MHSKVTMKQVASHAGVALGTVSNVLNRPLSVNTEMRRRVTAAIEELGYVRNDGARQLRVGHGRAIGFIVPNVSNPFFTDVARGAESVARLHSSSILLADTDEQEDAEEGFLDLFEEQRARGVLLSPSGRLSQKLDRLRSRGIPTVLVSSPSAVSGYSSVATDDVAGGRLAADHLLAQGHSKLLFVGGPLSLRQVQDRIAGAHVSLKSHGGSPGLLRVMGTSSLSIEAGRMAGQELMQLPTQEMPTGLIAANDLIAVGLLQTLHIEAGLRVPDDVAIIGYDDIDWAAATHIPLSTIRQPSALIGQKAVEILLRESASSVGEAPEQLLFAPELVARSSTVRASLA